MKKSGLFLFVMCTMIGSATAMFAKLTDEELVDTSTMIVVGELIGRESIGAAAGARTLGVIRIDETLKGDPAATVVFLKLPGSMTLRKSDDVDYPDGQQGLWYLRAGNDAGVYVADHPQRFVAMDKADEQIEALRTRLALK